MREGLYSLVKRADKYDLPSRIYNYFIVAVTLLSIMPLMFKEQNSFLSTVDIITVYILFADYIFRWLTYDIASGIQGWTAFIRYPFTIYAILDLSSLLPSMGLLSPHFRILRMFRIFKVLRYSDNFTYVSRVFSKERKTLMSVLFIAIFYIFVSALAIFTHEPENFEDFFEALYWASITLTTVGYGDISPVTQFGRLISIISSLFGIAVIAMPAGIITAGFLDEINNNKDEKGKDAEQVVKKIPRVSDALGKWRETAKNPVVRHHAIIMAVGVLMNEGLKAITETINLPVWLDITGTAFTAIVLDIPSALIVGLINNMYLAVAKYGAPSLSFYSISALVAIVTGVFVKKGKNISVKNILLAIIIIIVGSAALEAAISLITTAGQLPSQQWERYYYDMLISQGFGHYISCYLGTLAVKTFDTLASALIVAPAAFIALAIGKRVT